jgi:hypothetical protein
MRVVLCRVESCPPCRRHHECGRVRNDSRKALPPTVSMTVNFLAPAQPGPITGEARVTLNQPALTTPMENSNEPD